MGDSGELGEISVEERFELVIARITGGMTTTDACEDAGLGQAEYVRMREESPELEAKHNRAMADSYENEARRRALVGVEEITYMKPPVEGAPWIETKKVVRKDNELLSKMLAAHDPKYNNKLDVGVDISLKSVMGFLSRGELEAQPEKKVIDVRVDAPIDVPIEDAHTA